MEHVTGEEIAESMIDQAYGAQAYRDARERRTGTRLSIEGETRSGLYMSNARMLRWVLALLALAAALTWHSVRAGMWTR
jgi:hypothetical protein